MTPDDPNLERRARRAWFVPVILVLLVVVAVESILLGQQRAAERAARVQSSALLTQFLSGDTAATSLDRGVRIRLQDVRFKWSDKVYIDTGNMSVKAMPERGSVVNFDDLESFQLLVQQSVVLIRPDVLEGMFNESVFNYPDSRLRGLHVRLGKDDKGRSNVVLSGSLNMGLWIPFTMSTRLSVDSQTNTLVIEVDDLKAFKIIPATKFLSWTPFHLERLIAIPPNKSLMVDGNRLMVKPLGLFPPPRISGRMSAVEVGDQTVKLTFAGDPIAGPVSDAPHYVYLRGGVAQFGHLRMVDTDILIRDRDTTNVFGFSLLHYAELIPKSAIEMRDTRSVRITMPDY